MTAELFPLVAPYVAWMALMMALPATDAAYAARTIVSGALLAFAFWRLRANAASDCVNATSGCANAPLGRANATSGSRARARAREIVRAIGWGVAVGIAVLVIWVFPERFELYRRFCIIGEPAAEPRAIDALTMLRVFGSAFVIAPAEELFFRSFLYRWLQNRDWRGADARRFEGGAFFWMVALFAIEHNRIVVGAVAGAAYGLLAIRKGLPAAIVAHVVTNLGLALYIIATGEWRFW